MSIEDRSAALSFSRPTPTNKPDPWLSNPWVAWVGFPLLLIVAACAVYLNSLPGVFLLDDKEWIVDSPAVRKLFPVWELILNSGSRPALILSLAVNYAWGGLNPTGYHLFNIGVHVVTTLLLYGVVRRTLLLPSFGGRYDKNATTLALTIALIWTVHPLNTQAVTYIIQRSEAMMACGFLGCWYCYIRSTTSPRQWLWMLGSVAAFCFGAASKEVAVMAIPVLLLYDRAFISGSWRELFKRRGTSFVLLLLPLIVGAVKVLPGLLSSENETAGFGAKSVTALQYFFSQPAVLLHYLRLVFVPVGLCFDYGWPIEDRLLTGWIIPGLAIGGLFVGSIYAYWSGASRGLGWIGFGFLGLAFFLILAPTSSFMPIADLAVEHRMYLPMMLVIAAAVLGAQYVVTTRAQHVPKTCIPGCVWVICSLLAAQTVVRNYDYHSGVSMWSDVVSKVSRPPRQSRNLERVMVNLGEALASEGQSAESIAILEQALKVDPNSARAHGNLARVYIDQGKFADARPHVEKLMKDKPKNARYRQQAALIAIQEDKIDEAIGHFLAAIELSPNDPVIRINLGQAYASQQKAAEAEQQFREALRLEPQQSVARFKLVRLLLDAKQLGEADVESEQLVARFPADGQAHFLRGMICAELKKKDDAEKAFARSIELDPQNALAYYQLGNLLRDSGKPKSAADCFTRAVILRPDFSEAHNNLGALVVQSSPTVAARHFQMAINIQPAYWEARYNLATALLRAGQVDRAISQLKTVRQQRPDFAPAEATLRQAFALQAKVTPTAKTP